MELLAIVQSVYMLPTHEAQRIASLAEEIHAPKGHLIVEAERRSRFIYFIKTGVCRIYYPKATREVVLDFSFPGDALISLNSYIHGKPGYEHIDALETSTLYRISSSAISQLYAESVHIANWGRKLAELETLKIEERLMQQLFKSATERYHDLLLREPDLLQKVKLGLIASYLGVSQVTLSRIRSDIR